MPSARSQTIGGWPDMERGSYSNKRFNVGTESGCGIGVWMRRNGVSTGGTFCGVMSKGLPMEGTFSVRKELSALDRSGIDALEDSGRTLRRAVRVDDNNTLVIEAGGDGRRFALLLIGEVAVAHQPRRMHDGNGDTALLRRGETRLDLLQRLA